MLYLLLHFGLSSIALTCTACKLEYAFALLTALLVLYLLLYLHCVYAGVRICSTYCFTSEPLRGTALLALRILRSTHMLYLLLYFRATEALQPARRLSRACSKAVSRA